MHGDLTFPLCSAAAMQLTITIMRNPFYGYLHLCVTWAFKVFGFAFVISLQGEKHNSQEHKVRKRGEYFITYITLLHSKLLYY